MLQNNEVAEMTTYLSKVTPNINGFSIPIKSHRLVG
jgi:hypothetical protein